MKLFFLVISFCLLLPTSLLAQRTISPSQQVFAQQAQILRDLQRNVQILSSRLETIEQQQAALSSRMSALESSTGGVTRDDIAALRADLAATKADQSKMRGEIVSEISSKIVALQAKTQKAQAAAVETQKSGYTHEVEAGQTLSAIAQHYKVSVSSIMKANKITDPTRIRVGQKLFVPDP